MSVLHVVSLFGNLLLLLLLCYLWLYYFVAVIIIIIIIIIIMYRTSHSSVCHSCAVLRRSRTDTWTMWTAILTIGAPIIFLGGG